MTSAPTAAAPLADPPPPFDVCGPLPTGTTLLEASAGTGKTFTIAALATRYVAEGIARLAEITLVTFGRAATKELRQRVRERLVVTERALAHPAEARVGDDVLARHLADVPDAEVAVRRHRLTAALAAFDAATIATTHGFCQQMLARLGIAADTDRDTLLVADPRDLVDEVIDDLYLARYAAPEAASPQVTVGDARMIGRQSVADRQATLAPADAAPGTAASERYAFAAAVRAEFDRRKRSQGVVDYDDLLFRLRDTLLDPVTGGAALERIRSHSRVVLVDEFQDTDPVQWEVLKFAFHGHVTLVLIGDPKQAIYSFRGADVDTYLMAAGVAATHATLSRNWRSDGRLLDALSRVFRGAALGAPLITVRPVEAEHTMPRFGHVPDGSPLRIRVVTRSQAGEVNGGTPPVANVRALVAADVASDIVRLLGSDATVATGLRERAVRPGDLAVLVRTNAQASSVREALAGSGVPVVLSGVTSVFATSAAREWLTLLLALETPHRTGLVRAAALTTFVGWTAVDLAEADDRALDELGMRLRRWSDLLARRGVAALQEAVLSGRMQQRVLSTVSGERQLTDARHVGEELHAAALSGRFGIAAQVEWLQRRIVEAGNEIAEERSRRLESDTEAVQVLTVHSSKGLEFPVVYVPFGWDRWIDARPDPLLFHAADGARMLDVGGTQGPCYREHRDRHQQEESAEDLRLFYVAVTRAQCQVITWWAPSHNTPSSAASRLLLGEFAPGELPPATVPLRSDESVYAALSDLVATASGCIAVERVADRAAPPRWRPPHTASRELHAAVFDRRLDTTWGRTSYSALTAATHRAGLPGDGVMSEPDDVGLQDEPATAQLVADQPAPVDDLEGLRQIPSPMAQLPAGTSFGTLVHHVFETVDTGALDFGAELAARCRDAVAVRMSEIPPDQLAQSLQPAYETPLGPLAGGRCLRDFQPSDRLAELEFELPLAGGDHAVGAAAAKDAVLGATLGSVAALLRRHLRPADALHSYPELLEAPGLRDRRLRGYLTGSLDAVLRLRDGRNPGHHDRYLLVDYKTNWLGDSGAADPAAPEAALTAWHYREEALVRAVQRAHYPLQFLLYLVALHRFLRWRQPDYDPSVHLGGVLYLFVRGMCGPQALSGGSPPGVFAWQPPAGLVEQLSGLLDGGAG